MLTPQGERRRLCYSGWAGKPGAPRRGPSLPRSPEACRVDESDPLPADTLEGGFDRAAMRDQQLQDALDRTLTFPVTIDPDVSGEMPVPAGDRLLGWNGTGTALENKTLPSGTAVYSSTANTNLGASVAEAVTPKGLHDSIYNPVGRHLVPISAAGLIPDTTTAGGGPFLTANLTATNKVSFVSMDFDASTQEFAGFAIAWPKSADEGTITYRVRWTATGGSGTGVSFTLYASARSDLELIDVGYGTGVMVQDTYVNTGGLHVTPESAAMTIQNSLSEGDTVFFRLGRTVSDANDNVSVDAKVIGIDIFIVTAAGNDA